MFAIGDVTQGLPLAHRAMMQGRVAGDVLGGKAGAFDTRAIPRAVFAEPEIAAVGMTEAEAQAAGIEVSIGKFPLAALGRAVIESSTAGFAKLIFAKDGGALLGAHLAGPRSTELVAEMALALEMGATSEDLALTVHAHPTFAESVMEAAEVSLGRHSRARDKALITRVFFAARRSDLTTEACLAHWSGHHSAIGAKLPKVRGYVQNHGILAGGRFLLPYPGFDIMPELDWDDLAEMDAAIDSPAHEKDSIDDEANFIDTARTGYAVTTRRALMDLAPGVEAVKLITLLRRAPNASEGALAEALTGPYAVAVAGAGPLRHEVLIAIPDRAGRPPFWIQAIDILWFATPQDALAWTASDAAYRAAWHLAGVAAGTERLIARPHRVV